MTEIEMFFSEVPRLVPAKLRGIEEKRDFTLELQKRMEDFYNNKKQHE
jgi:hypothetical protein